MANPGNVGYEENDKPRMGAVRPSFHKNVLLVKPKLGATREPTSKLPYKDWIYGVCNDFDVEGVKEVLVHKENEPDRERKRGPDILAMNKLAAIRNLSKACQQLPFRKKHLIRLHISRRVGKSPSAKLPSELDPNYTYGKPGEPNEEMWKVMGFGFADDWIKMNLQHPHVIEEAKPSFKCPIWNKSARLKFQETANKMHSPPPKERFIISKFKNVPKRIDNYNPTPLKRD